MTSTSIARVPPRERAHTSAPVKLGVFVVAVAAGLVLAAASVVLVSAVGDAMAAIGAFLFGTISVAVVIEAIRLARQASALADPPAELRKHPRRTPLRDDPVVESPAP